MKIRNILIILALLTLVYCSPRLNTFPSLVNKGIMTVSPGNAYLGANLFLGDEAAKSRILFQFLKGRGAPGAIKIVEEDFNRARMSLYYPRQQQVYVADLAAAKHSYEWIVRGPYSINREDYRKILEVDKAYYEAAPIFVNGKIERFVAEPTPVPTKIPTPISTPKPKPTKKKVKAVVTPKIPEGDIGGLNVAVEIPTPRRSLEIPSGNSLNSDQQAIRVSRGLTELSPEGDLLHRVKSEAESMDSIANWYTGDLAKAKAIAEYNSLPAGTSLPKGAKIKIPKALVKNEKAMPLQAVLPTAVPTAVPHSEPSTDSSSSASSAALATEGHVSAKDDSHNEKPEPAQHEKASDPHAH